jgi:hypothetical protein
MEALPVPRPTKEQQARVAARDGTICRPCGNHLTYGTFFPCGEDHIRICGDCQQAEKRRDLGLSGNPDAPNGVVCHGIITHGRDGERSGHWTC